MCGIFAYVGTKDAAPLLVAGLKTLEYRGYDSAGIFVPGNPRYRTVGPIVELEKVVPKTVQGTSGIAHTRWATHGPPTKENAHPHVGGKGIHLVHNGIIENYRELKEKLATTGASFASQTDSEVLATLIAAYYDGDLPAAVRSALKRVRGTYGIAVMVEADPDTIVVARRGSPIVLGLGEGAHFVSSDPSALLAHTKRVVYLEDGELAVVRPGGYHIEHRDGGSSVGEPETLDWDVEQVKKQGYEHFMLKEIHEAPAVIENTCRGRLVPEQGTVKLGGLEEVLRELATLDRLTITACGSAYYAGLFGKYVLEEYALLPIDIELASEFRYKTNLPTNRSALLAVSQSGETADTLAAVRLGRELNMLTLGMVNVVGSTIARETDAGVYNHAGPEVAVASTKAVVSQMTAFVLLSVLIGRERGMSEATATEIVEALESLPETVADFLRDTSEIEAVARKYHHYRDAMFIGRNAHVPVAYEGSLKLKEVSYIHAEAYAGGELKHGSIAMLDEQFPLFALVPEDGVHEKMVSNIEEVKARQAPVVAITTPGATAALAELADDVITVPTVHPIVQPIVSVMPLHLLAYHIGVARDINVDRPRNLAKSVTVE